MARLAGLGVNIAAVATKGPGVRDDGARGAENGRGGGHALAVGGEVTSRPRDLLWRDGVLLRRILLGFVFFSEALHYL